MDGQLSLPIAVLGAGSWGTALALYLARRGQHVNIWSVDPSEIEAMLRDKANVRYLPGHRLPDCIFPTTDLSLAVKECEEILVVVPSVGFRQTLTALKSATTKPVNVICASKGLDTASGELLSDVATEVLDLDKDDKFAVLSGPSFAKEVAAGLPAALVIATQDTKFLQALVKRFNSDIFHIDTSDDIIGVEIGGVVKNVIAIATGMSDGMALGANARSAIITRGLAEIIRLGTTLGGKQETFVGLSGLGDLILTCSDNQSRNRRLGLAIGQGRDIQTAEREIGQVVEGKRNAELVVALAKHHQISMPVCENVWKILQGKRSVKEALLALLSGK